MIVSVHQPSFFHYEGGLDKIRQSDLHIVLAHAQFERGNYQNRFRLGERWFTMSVNQRLEPLNKKFYANPRVDFEAIKRRIPEYAGALSRFDDLIQESLVLTNVGIAKRVCEILGIDTPFVFDGPTELRGTARLVDLCRRAGATTYLSGPSGPKYLDFDLFQEAGIEVDVQERGSARAAVELLLEKEMHRAA